MNYKEAWNNLKTSLQICLLLTDYDSLEPGGSGSAVEGMVRTILEAMGESEKLIDKEAVEDEKD